MEMWQQRCTGDSLVASEPMEKEMAMARPQIWYGEEGEDEGERKKRPAGQRMVQPWSQRQARHPRRAGECLGWLEQDEGWI